MPPKSPNFGGLEEQIANLYISLTPSAQNPSRDVARTAEILQPEIRDQNLLEGVWGKQSSPSRGFGGLPQSPTSCRFASPVGDVDESLELAEHLPLAAF